MERAEVAARICAQMFTSWSGPDDLAFSRYTDKQKAEFAARRAAVAYLQADALISIGNVSEARITERPAPLPPSGPGTPYSGVR